MTQRFHTCGQRPMVMAASSTLPAAQKPSGPATTCAAGARAPSQTHHSTRSPAQESAYSRAAAWLGVTTVR
ncbi:MAG: hypothetical protein MUC86_06140 [Burkholderiaceae bacterium]|nr:hypothetical protein [Burkholderiaceae bacterium]